MSNIKNEQMKNISLITIFMMLGFCFSTLQAQRLEKSEVPEKVQKAFKTNHPGAFPYDWKYAKKKKAYKAYYISNGMKFKSYFKANGDWMYAKTKIDKTDIPQHLWEDYSKSEWVDWKISKTQLRLTPDCGKIYIINIKRGKKSTKEKVKLYYDENGKFMKYTRKE